MANQPRMIDVLFPAAGYDASLAYQQQPPYTSSKMANARLRNAINRRSTGGSRPGLKKAFAQQLGSGNPVVMGTVIQVAVEAGIGPG